MKSILPVLFLISICFTGLNCTKDASSGQFGSPSGQGGSMARFTIAGNYLYTVDKENLKVFSLASPGEPLLKKTVRAGFEIETIYPLGDKLFIGSTSVIHIFSIADPENPVQLSTAIAPTVMRRCDPVVAKNNVAYATLRTNGSCGGTESKLVAFDITNIVSPVLKASILVAEPYGLGYQDQALYVCDRSGLYIFDIGDEFDPRLIGQISGEWYLDVIPMGNTLICWIEDGIKLYDITTRLSPKLIAKII